MSRNTQGALQRLSQKQQVIQQARRETANNLSHTRPDWDVVAGTFSTIGENLLGFVTEFVAQHNRVAEAGGATDMSRRLVATACADCQVFSDELAAINAQHKGRTGGVMDVESMDIYYQVCDLYQNLYERLQRQVFSYATEMTTILSSVNATIKTAEVEGAPA